MQSPENLFITEPGKSLISRFGESKRERIQVCDNTAQWIWYYSPSSVLRRVVSDNKNA